MKNYHTNDKFTIWADSEYRYFIQMKDKEIEPKAYDVAAEAIEEASGRMRTDYTYCLNKDTCVHRRGCKRWIGNYTEEEVHKLYTENRFVSEVDYEECIKDDGYPFAGLDRFRLSDGTEMKK